VKLATLHHLIPRSRMRGAIPLIPNTPPSYGAQLKKKHRDNFTFHIVYKSGVIWFYLNY